MVLQIGGIYFYFSELVYLMNIFGSIANSFTPWCESWTKRDKNSLPWLGVQGRDCWWARRRSRSRHRDRRRRVPPSCRWRPSAGWPAGSAGPRAHDCSWRFVFFLYKIRDKNKCCGSIPSWCGSGSGYPCLWLMDPDPDPAIFIIALQDARKN